MRKLIGTGRLAVLSAVLALLVVFCIMALYELQIIEGAAYYEMSQNSIVSKRTITAARGNILDRYGRVLVSNRMCNNLIFNANELFKQEDPNAIILQIVHTVVESGDEYNDSLPITMEPPFEYIDKMTDIQKRTLMAYLDDKKMDRETSAVDLMAYFRERYKIDPAYDAKDMRIIAGIRYEINSRYSENFSTSDYIFAEDVSITLIEKLMESGLPGIDVQSSYIRECNTDFAAHILGYTSTMEPNEVEKYKEQGYDLNAQVGRVGAELAFEEQLHGLDGTAADTRTATGTVINTVYTKSPVPGNHVYLSIDIALQKAAEQALSSVIANVNAEREAENAILETYGDTKNKKELVTGGAVVAIDIKTGEPLCIASYPSFSIKTFEEDSEMLNEEGNNDPLYNRALDGTYAPGSTFKPITALSSLENGIITPGATIYDAVTFTKYADKGYAPTCWIKSRGGSHGDVNCTSAIAHSCNYYFYTVGDQLGIKRLDETAKEFGLGEYTGIELQESKGNMASPEYKASFYEEDDPYREWYAGDQLSAAIGQSYSNFTPIQLANYTTALANNGTLNKVSILRSVRSYDFSEQIYEHKPELMNQIDLDQSYYDAVKQGMFLVTTTDASPTVRDAFLNSSYTVAAKTGTAELGEGQKETNACFIAFAPFENPEIAIAVVVEKGGSGSSIAVIARQVLDYYFSFKNSEVVLERELSMLK